MTFGVNPLPDWLIRCREASHACISVVGIFGSLKMATSFASVTENVLHLMKRVSSGSWWKSISWLRYEDCLEFSRQSQDSHREYESGKSNSQVKLGVMKGEGAPPCLESVRQASIRETVEERDYFLISRKNTDLLIHWVYSRELLVTSEL